LLVLPDRQRGCAARREGRQGEREEEKRVKARGGGDESRQTGARGLSGARLVSRARRGRHDDDRVSRGVDGSGAARARVVGSDIRARRARDFERDSCAKVHFQISQI
jgi:hypothetical protein